MAAIGDQVEEVVEQIDSGGGEPEGQEGETSGEQLGAIADLVSGEQGQEEQQVLGPLMEAQGAPQGGGPGRGGENALDPSDLAGGPDQPGAADDDGVAGGGPDGEIGVGIADIVKAALAKVLHQGGGLGGAFEVVLAVAGEDLGEEADAVGDGLGDALIGGGGQDQTAAGGPFLAQPVDEFSIQRQGGHLQGCQGNEAGLEGGAALAKAGQSGK